MCLSVCQVASARASELGQLRQKGQAEHRLVLLVERAAEKIQMIEAEFQRRLQVMAADSRAAEAKFEVRSVFVVSLPSVDHAGSPSGQNLPT
jgi:hypothetical protein